MENVFRLQGMLYDLLNLLGTHILKLLQQSLIRILSLLFDVLGALFFDRL